MNCPKCEGKPMEVAQVSGVGVDRCARCGGVWLDPGELDQLSTLEWAEVRGVAGGKGVPELNQKRAQCPRDGAALLRVYSAQRKSVVLDRCGQCGGLWLDGGELRSLLSGG